jgi:hypothetical protein
MRNRRSYRSDPPAAPEQFVLEQQLGSFGFQAVFLSARLSFQPAIGQPQQGRAVVAASAGHAVERQRDLSTLACGAVTPYALASD